MSNRDRHRPHKPPSSCKKDVSWGDFFLAHLDPKYANRELFVEVNYENVDLRDYVTRERIQPGKREITEFAIKET